MSFRYRSIHMVSKIFDSMVLFVHSNNRTCTYPVMLAYNILIQFSLYCSTLEAEKVLFYRKTLLYLIPLNL